MARSSVQGSTFRTPRTVGNRPLRVAPEGTQRPQRGSDCDRCHNVNSVARLRPLFAEHAPLPGLANWPAYRWVVVGTVCLGAFLGQLDASIAGLVLPTLEDVFNAPVASGAHCVG